MNWDFIKKVISWIQEEKDLQIYIEYHDRWEHRCRSFFLNYTLKYWKEGKIRCVDWDPFTLDEAKPYQDHWVIYNGERRQIKLVVLEGCVLDNCELASFKDMAIKASFCKDSLHDKPFGKIGSEENTNRAANTRIKRCNK